MTFVFVYGTLKKGQGNHRFMKTSKFIESVTVKGISLHIDKESGLPFAMQNPQGKISGEIYEVDDKALSLMDRLEGHPKWYKRKQFNIKNKKIWIYLNPQEAVNFPIIPSGKFEPIMRFKEHRSFNA